MVGVVCPWAAITMHRTHCWQGWCSREWPSGRARGGGRNGVEGEGRGGEVGSERQDTSAWCTYQTPCKEQRADGPHKDHEPAGPTGLLLPWLSDMRLLLHGAGCWSLMTTVFAQVAPQHKRIVSSAVALNKQCLFPRGRKIGLCWAPEKLHGDLQRDRAQKDVQGSSLILQPSSGICTCRDSSIPCLFLIFNILFKKIIPLVFKFN